MKLRRWASLLLAVAATVGLPGRRADAAYTRLDPGRHAFNAPPIQAQVAPAFATADAATPADAWLVESIIPLGRAEDGDHIELVTFLVPRSSLAGQGPASTRAGPYADQETHTRVLYIVKSPLGLFLIDATKDREDIKRQIDEMLAQDEFLSRRSQEVGFSFIRDPEFYKRAAEVLDFTRRTFGEAGFAFAQDNESNSLRYSPMSLPLINHWWATHGMETWDTKQKWISGATRVREQEYQKRYQAWAQSPVGRSTIGLRDQSDQGRRAYDTNVRDLRRRTDVAWNGDIDAASPRGRPSTMPSILRNERDGHVHSHSPLHDYHPSGNDLQSLKDSDGGAILHIPYSSLDEMVGDVYLFSTQGILPNVGQRRTGHGSIRIRFNTSGQPIASEYDY